MFLIIKITFQGIIHFSVSICKIYIYQITYENNTMSCFSFCLLFIKSVTTNFLTACLFIIQLQFVLHFDMVHEQFLKNWISNICIIYNTFSKSHHELGNIGEVEVFQQFYCRFTWCLSCYLSCCDENNDISQYPSISVVYLIKLCI